MYFADDRPYFVHDYATSLTNIISRFLHFGLITQSTPPDVPNFTL
uniref:Uncharacterized protein n=1 Tax=Arundo donax TaxID=35708 RepID=A0A0A9FN19_ARUDO